MKLSRNAVRGLIAVPLVAAGAAVLWWRLPQMVRAKVEQQAEARSGMTTSVGDVSVGLTSTTLHDLALGQVEGSESTGPRLRVARVELGVNLISAAFGGLGALNSVTLSDLSVELPLQDAATRELLGKLASRRRQRSSEADVPASQASGGDEGARSASGRSLVVDGFTLRVTDSHGVLLEAHGPRASRDGSSFSLDLTRLTVGSAPGARAELAPVHLEGDPRAGMQLQKLTVGDLQLTLAELPRALAQAAAGDGADPRAADAGAAPQRQLDEEGPPAPEDSEVAQRPSQAGKGPRDGRGPDEPGAETGARQPTSPPAQPPEPGSPATTYARLLAALDLVRARADEAATGAAAAGGEASRKRPASAEAEPAPAGADHPLMRHIAADAEIALEGGRVRDAAGGTVLENLHARLSRKGDDALSCAGGGAGERDGSIGWDLRLRPAALAADGEVTLSDVPLSLIAPLLPALPWADPELARVDAKLVVSTESVERIALSGEASVRNATIASSRIAPTPVRDLSATVRGRGYFLPMKKRLEIESATLAFGGAEVELSGALEYSRDHYLIDIDAHMPPTQCTEAVHSIPHDLLGEMALATWRGKIGGDLKLVVDSRDLPNTVLELDIDDHCEFATVPAMADLRRFRLPFTHSVLEPDGTVFEMETGPGTPAWTYLEDISPFFVHAVLAHEDAGFFRHQGFSLPHIRAALAKNLERGRYVVGASTITMQLVKNIFLHREKTLARKIQEVLLTWWIERVMEKRDILELYLNVIEYGPSVYGIRNAARHYFNRLPSQLSPAESVYLSTILPNPKAYHSHFERGAVPPGWIDKMRAIFARMEARGWYSEEAVAYGLKELEHFKFVPEGTITEARVIPGTAAPLPYMQDGDGLGGVDGPLWDWGDPAPAPAADDPGGDESSRQKARSGIHTGRADGPSRGAGL